ncbi:hypothetical protein C9374_002936 [Naegleria lovaniensis]|uniref:Uncharacterized protein n=1 Tax=Naegleria lovaniensis TaxID=51637 RepID=A0AA88GRN9_NAELO|nr:uncharacterized protein C9374_002936 [Naegleria lovaniensis]KAG2385787.1 hypothetical protein C9374_002936 [Naegleria lovaniensis]
MPNNNEEIDSTLGASELTPTTASSSLQPTTPLSAISNVYQSPLDHNNSDHHDDHHDNRSDYYGRELSDYSSSTMSNENSSTITNHPLNNNRNSINNSDHDHYNINDRNTTTTRRQTNRLDFTASTPAASSTSTQSHAPSFQTPTNTSTIFNNDFFQNQEVRRMHKQLHSILSDLFSEHHHL